MKLILTVILLCTSIFAKEQQKEIKFYKPSFDCKNVVKGSIGYKICTNEKLSSLDVDLSTIYDKLKQTMPQRKEIIKDKISFLTQRDNCKDEECIKNIYQNQIHTLVKTYEIYRINKIFEIVEKVSPDNFIHPNNRKSTLLTNELLKFIQNKKIKNIKFENNYLFTAKGNRLSSGLYCINNSIGEIKKLNGGFIKTWQEFNQKQSLKIITLSNSGKKGVGYTEVSLLDINKDCSIKNKKTILEYNYDMESGLCGKEELALDKSGDIKDITFDTQNQLIKINANEQKCPNGKIINKKYIFNISEDRFINKKG